MTEKIQVEVAGQTIEIERRDDGKFIKPDILKQLEGFNVALKPAWEPIIVAVNPRDGTFVNNALKWGVSGLWIDGGRIAHNEECKMMRAQDDKDVMSGGGKYQQAGRHQDVLELKPEGRWPANLILSHVLDQPCFCGGDWPECPYCGGDGVIPGCQRRGTRKVEGHSGYPNGPGGKSMHYTDQESRGQEVRPDAWEPSFVDSDGKETVADWDCYPDCPVKVLAEQSGERPGPWSPKGNKNDSSGGYGGWAKGKPENSKYHGDTGTAARFFYTPKASSSERNEGCDHLYWIKDEDTSIEWRPATREEWLETDEKKARGNIHPTVKPVAILRYLVRLTKTPSGGVVLDPFAGSASTGVACIQENRDFIGIELEPSYVLIGEARLKHHYEKPVQKSLFDCM
jgi:hypothetical protein